MVIGVTWHQSNVPYRGIVIATTGGFPTLLWNIVAALDYLDQITAQTRIVIELSSLQLAELLLAQISRNQAVTSEIWDFYLNTAAYVAAKNLSQSIKRFIIYFLLSK
jgi:UDP-N-acetylmuramoylalanine-D-glutamate ligase